MALRDGSIGNVPHPLTFRRMRDLNKWMQSRSICGVQLRRRVYWMSLPTHLKISLGTFPSDRHLLRTQPAN
jgi:hypothetical protein